MTPEHTDVEVTDEFFARDRALWGHLPPAAFAFLRLVCPRNRVRYKVLAAMGLTISDAVRLLLTRVVREKALPVAPLVPNAITIETMKEARQGNLPQFASVEDLPDDLHAGD